jgi:hypothetical protein
VAEERFDLANPVRSEVLEQHAKALLRISYALKEVEPAEEIRAIAYALRELARESSSAPD